MGQQPAFKSLKVNSDPYLQFNDIVEFKKEIWLVSNKGICKYQNGKLVKTISEQNLSQFVNAENKLLVWSIYGEFFEVVNNKLIPLPFNALLSSRLQNKIINSVIYNDSTFWISSVIGEGLIRIDLKKETVNNIAAGEGFPSFVKRYGQNLISGNNINSSDKKLIVELDKPFYIPLAENQSLSKTNAIVLKDGSFIFTRQYEAVRFNNKKIINRVFVEKNIEEVYQDFEGKVWLALNGGGAVCYADANFNSSNVIRYLGNKTVISVTQDSKGNMWFGTSGSGVFMLKKTIPIQYDSPDIYSSTNEKTENITSKMVVSNIPELNEANSKIISTSLAQEQLIPPVVFINNIKINGKDVALMNYYELNHQSNNLEINISGIHKSTSELQYKYILEGKDTSWNYSANTNFYYTSLAPGSYTFKAFAMSDKGVWSKTPAIITFNIIAPFYSSLWFVLTIILLIAAIVLLIIYFIHRKKQIQQQLLEEEKRKVLVSELHALRSQMNPHFIFNTLSSIQSFITQNSSANAVSYLSKFSKLMRATLENTQQPRVSIKSEIEMLSLYMDLEKLRLNNKFNYEIKVADNIDTQFDEIPPLLIQPYVENAIWHGISHKETTGLIKINFELIEEDMLKCTIEDNGVGRKKSREINAHQKKNQSLGMSITKERLEIINSLKNSNLNINIVDLTDNNKALGTQIELFIPLD